MTCLTLTHDLFINDLVVSSLLVVSNFAILTSNYYNYIYLEDSHSIIVVASIILVYYIYLKSYSFQHSPNKSLWFQHSTRLFLIWVTVCETLPQWATAPAPASSWWHTKACWKTHPPTPVVTFMLIYQVQIDQHKLFVYFIAYN